MRHVHALSDATQSTRCHGSGGASSVRAQRDSSRRASDIAKKGGGSESCAQLAMALPPAAPTDACDGAGDEPAVWSMAPAAEEVT
jgi:hypothetical protein